jgi:hypothetical protein
LRGWEYFHLKVAIFVADFHEKVQTNEMIERGRSEGIPIRFMNALSIDAFVLSGVAHLRRLCAVTEGRLHVVSLALLSKIRMAITQ